MKIIDFHCHVFPENMAEKTLNYLMGVAPVTAHTDGTYKGLLNSMRESGVYASVALSVATKPESSRHINEFLTEVNMNPGLFSFGAIHPDCEDYREILDDIKSRGFKGIKLHPQYQNADVCDPRYVRIVRYAAELGLVIIFHGGLDIGIPGLDLSNPIHTAKLLDEVPEAKIVMAHFGGWNQWDLVEEYLVGRNVYFDTSSSFDKLSKEQAERIIKKHGSDKVVFATDSPWGSHTEDIEMINSLDLTKSEFEDIFHGTAEKLLGI